ncbi:hypothetical protein [Sphingobacterium sp.]|uniref:hypothetical protein n=1 Tax=Sphingobacterium sp. TaxID=341027 RepID=UPI0025878016|nr:hypothetical protein [Sphingobacterium sp.]WET68841.1 MAG: hypothetical protein P0Y57_23670 [Sphingobacterium sp.]
MLPEKKVFLSAVLLLIAAFIFPISIMLEQNTVAPDFTLFATPDQKITLSEFKGRNVILAGADGILDALENLKIK